MDLELIPAQKAGWRPPRTGGHGRLKAFAGFLTLAAFMIGVPVEITQAQTAPAGKAQAPRSAQIDRNGALILIRSALLALDQANKTGNYTVLRDLGAPGFQANTAARLGDIFGKQREQNLDLSGVAVIDPQLTLLPQIEANGMMHMAGSFPSIPSPVNFELVFAPVSGQWRLFGISVAVGQAASTPAPAAQPAGPPSPDDGKSSRVKQRHHLPAAARQP